MLRSPILVLLLSTSLSLAACSNGSPGTSSEERACDAGPVVARVRDRLATGPIAGLETTHFPTFVSSRLLAMPGDVDYEVCTDDADEALRWATLANEGLSVRSTIVDAKTTRELFEFTTDKTAGWGVHRCSYIDLSPSNDRGGSSLFLGVLNARPLGADVATRAALETFAYTTPGLSYEEARYRIVLGCTPSEAAGQFVLTCDVGTITEGDYDLPAEASIRTVRITVDRDTGEMRRITGPITATEREVCR